MSEANAGDSALVPQPLPLHATRPYATSDIPGTGGVIKQRPEDFLVDEIPAYEPGGEGEHIYLLIQKRELSTLEVVDMLARHFGVQRLAIGYAGLKDKHALTRQVFSIHVPGKKIEDFPSFDSPQAQVMWADYHANKLRPGHLKGNRFSIRIRDIGFEGLFSGVKRASAVIERLAKGGVPNRFGPQRFGILGNNHEVGRAIIARDFDGAINTLLGPNANHPDVNTRARELFAAKDYAGAMAALPRSARPELQVLRALSRGQNAKRAIFAMDFTHQQLYISAFQSAVFNRVLDARINDATWTSLRPGDLAFKHDSGAVFAIAPDGEPDAALADRAARHEISPSGPMWCANMTRAKAAIDTLEVGALEAAGLPLAALEAFGERAPRGLMDGSRRPLRVPLANPDVEGGMDEHGPFIRLAFDLPRGAFATSVVEEITKSDRAVGAEGGRG